MKKINELVKQSIGQKRWQNEVQRKDIDYCPYRPKKMNKSKKAVEYIRFPEYFSIYSADKNKYYKDTMNIIYAISRMVNTNTKKVHLDFSQTEYIKAASILILYAAIEHAINLGVNFRIISFPKDYRATRMIKNSGLEVLCKENIHQPNFDGDYIPVISGSGGDFRDEIVDFIQHKIYKNKMTADTESKYGGAVQEAINNVAYHAYPDIPESSNKKWWVKCDLAGDQLFLAIYDKGVGIPKTVMNRSWFEEILESTYPKLVPQIKQELEKEGVTKKDLFGYKFGIISDAMKIAISMVGDVTGTEESKHGQGSKSIKALVTENDQGTLWIYSNNGLYKLKSGIVTTYDLQKPMPGTLLQWNIKVDLDELEKN
ncbi:ATP-binding protein [Cronobacter dublinensis]|uniref:ATP-binding protein n=1 Tax=Cronobacter dublinensis TaxID=413497 RepID=UPI000CFAF032|nr:ATP-binding protein [Cronobacter dublinensis]EKM5761197.1 ATP-binding protein [Cronobacter turicensis]